MSLRTLWHVLRYHNQLVNAMKTYQRQLGSWGRRFSNEPRSSRFGVLLTSQAFFNRVPGFQLPLEVFTWKLSYGQGISGCPTPPYLAHLKNRRLDLDFRFPTRKIRTKTSIDIFVTVQGRHKWKYPFMEDKRSWRTMQRNHEKCSCVGATTTTPT